MTAPSCGTNGGHVADTLALRRRSLRGIPLDEIDDTPEPRAGEIDGLGEAIVSEASLDPRCRCIAVSLANLSGSEVGFLLESFGHGSGS